MTHSWEPRIGLLGFEPWALADWFYLIDLIDLFGLLSRRIGSICADEVHRGVIAKMELKAQLAAGTTQA